MVPIVSWADGMEVATDRPILLAKKATLKKQSDAYRNYIQSPRWRRKSAWVRSLTRHCWLPRSVPGRCCLFPWLPNRATHHLTYFFILNLGWNWFGFELPCWHLVPLSKTAHDLVGQPWLWRQPVRFFVNTYLRLAFLVLWTICKPLWSIPVWGSCLMLGLHFRLFGGKFNAFVEELINFLEKIFHQF